MPYSFKNTEAVFKGGKNILASSHLQFKEVGGTFDATAFPTGLVDVGTCVVRNDTTGKFEPYTDAKEGVSDHCILNVDFINDGVHDTVVGELLIRASVYEPKLVGVTDAFKAATPMIRYVKHSN